MAMDAMAIAGVPPPAAGPPAATGATGAPDGEGRPFAELIAQALERPAGAKTGGVPVPGAVPALVDPASAQLLAALGAGGGQAVPEAATVPGVTRPDRDAEAEDAAAALAALMLGSPAQAAPVTVPVGPMPAVAAAEGGPAPELGATLVAGLAAGAAPAGDAPAATRPEVAGAQEAPAGGPVSEYGWQPSAAPVTRPTGNADASAAAVTALPRVASPPAEAGEQREASTVEVQAFEVESATPAAGAEAGRAATPLPATERVEGRAERGATSSVTAHAAAASAASALAAPPVPTAEAMAPVATAPVVDASGVTLASGIADTVQAATLRGDRELRIALNPPDLGHLTVQITEHDSGGVTVAIRASSGEARDLLQQQLPMLRAGLEQREVRVERLQVEQQASSAGLGWADGRQREADGGRRDAWSPRGEQQWSPIASMDRVRAPAPAARSGGVPGDGHVDLRA